jgi:hypothetical protein
VHKNYTIAKFIPHECQVILDRRREKLSHETCRPTQRILDATASSTAAASTEASSTGTTGGAASTDPSYTEKPGGAASTDLSSCGPAVMAACAMEAVSTDVSLTVAAGG